MQRSTSVITLLAACTLAACGGGGSSSEAVAPTPSPSPAPVPVATSKAAVEATVASNASCSVSALGAYYWEIGDASGKLDSGSVGTQSNGSPIVATDELSIASASKWLYAAYVVQKRGGSLTSTDIPLLNFTSGWSNFSNADCQDNDTVASCMNGAQNTTEAANHEFHYNGGHLQEHASTVMGLGPLTNDTLGAEITSTLGISVTYTAPQLAGGAKTTAAQYAVFLRKLMGSSPALKMGTMLGSNAVCTNPSDPNSSCNPSSSPPVVPENWHYSLGHWVEDDSATLAGNFAYSSGGAFGFYPWVNSDRTVYGLIAREQANNSGEGYDSSLCGRALRLAWKTGVAQ